MSKRATTNGLSGEDVGDLYDDLQPWAAELCEQAYLDSLSAGRRRRAARMDFVPGWKEAHRQAGRQEMFLPRPEPPTPIYATSHAGALKVWAQHRIVEECKERGIPRASHAAFAEGFEAALSSIHRCMLALSDAPSLHLPGQDEQDEAEE